MSAKAAKTRLAIEELAADIAARGLLQSLSVRPILGSMGVETGLYGIQAGSRRFRALKLLVKQKKLAKNAPVPCIVKTDGFAEADSLAENIRAPGAATARPIPRVQGLGGQGPRRGYDRRRFSAFRRSPSSPAPAAGQRQPRHPQSL